MTDEHWTLQAIETRRESDKQSCLARAMAVAETEAATKAIVSTEAPAWQLHPDHALALL